MSYQQVRGVYYSAVRGNETQSGLPTTENKYVSFRLVHDALDNAKGRFWKGSKPEPVRVSVQSPITNYERKFFVVGFRLARETE